MSLALVPARPAQADAARVRIAYNAPARVLISQ
jgi:hypothetical protein